jgi:hypothetical protein
LIGEIITFVPSSKESKSEIVSIKKHPLFGYNTSENRFSLPQPPKCGHLSPAHQILSIFFPVVKGLLELGILFPISAGSVSLLPTFQVLTALRY